MEFANSEQLKSTITKLHFAYFAEVKKHTGTSRTNDSWIKDFGFTEISINIGRVVQ